MLNDVAAVLRRIFRRSDYIGRIGDDEFLVLLRDVEPERLSEKKAQEFLYGLGTLFSARGDERYKPTCSVRHSPVSNGRDSLRDRVSECRRRTA